nr:immunoglobulin heavy chain junction region [Macaca mulatta]MOX93840.1 immunoglobulin heavy chain junction region [Macaca mulatta]MOX95368.1 immunoglobulin heavy chain junction region [Macaca mulatta]MOX95926.1 immunoglobulin heavy chain junction region [Macaca mulatta]MOX96357.1 immunoglobulin heavy chain junction region [Macaca mulatta]
CVRDSRGSGFDYW